MKPRMLFRSGLLALLAALAVPAIAGAVMPSPEGLSVALYADLLNPPVSQTTTDAEGIFLLPDVAAGNYFLTVADAGEAMKLQFKLEVASALAPAAIVGQIFTSDKTDVGLTVLARVVAQVQPGPFAVDSAWIHPRKWNRNYLRSAGRVQVVLRGSGLAAVTRVTLRSGIGSVATSVVRLDPAEEVGVVSFTKSEAFAALVPADAPAWTLVPVTVEVESPGGLVSFEKQILILGRKPRPLP